ncbi:hypothetical protein EVAR_12730_1 [Eumeta japonica]|uniref:Uncharacterized protein n=1 Tax=Eumeta variegata TaxID=151549 RepID=A0A4C1UPC0_EUMVA|nr:hypothetical protein EVAR_12730_1 [Eumeta japonica]
MDARTPACDVGNIVFSIHTCNCLTAGLRVIAPKQLTGRTRKTERHSRNPRVGRPRPLSVSYTSSDFYGVSADLFKE